LNFNPVTVHKAADMISAAVMVARGLWQLIGTGFGAQPQAARCGVFAAGARYRIHHRPALCLSPGRNVPAAGRLADLHPKTSDRVEAADTFQSIDAFANSIGRCIWVSAA
jgi:hypothetical protein